MRFTIDVVATAPSNPPTEAADIMTPYSVAEMPRSRRMSSGSNVAIKV